MDPELHKCTAIAAGKKGSTFRPHRPDNGCSRLISWFSDGPSNPGQTGMNWKPSSSRSGRIALNGLNSPVGRRLRQRRPQLAYSPNGLPVAFRDQGILRQKTYEDAVKFLRDIPPAAPRIMSSGRPISSRPATNDQPGRMCRFIPF